MYYNLEAYLYGFVEDIWKKHDKDNIKGWLQNYGNQYRIKPDVIVEEIIDYLIDTGEIHKETVFGETLQNIIYSKRNELAEHLEKYVVSEINDNYVNYHYVDWGHMWANIFDE